MKIIFYLIKVVVLIHLLFCFVNEAWTTTFICLFNLVSLSLADFVQKKFKYNNLFLLLIFF